jgi:hypothetical protein
MRLFFAVGLVGGLVAVTAAPADAAAGWTVASNPSPRGPTDGGLLGLSCPNATSCFAVGGSNAALVEHWDGTNWSIMASPNVGGASNLLSGVSCPTTTTCFAVGSKYTSSAQTLVERWNGASWSIMASPNPDEWPYSAGLSAVWCRSATSCFAVGDFAANGAIHTLVEQWDGNSWSIVTSPDPAGATRSHLTDVKCPTTTMCVAVGNAEDGSATKTLVEQWDGSSWSVVPNPNPAGDTISELSGVACPAPTTCFAVGASGDTSTQKALLERWDGTSWSVTPGPILNGFRSHLRSVKCLSTTSCHAVGADGSNTVIERWDGAAWNKVASPNGSQSESALNAVWCTSGTNCNAVGRDDPYVLAEHWNGTRWTVAPRAFGSSQSELTAVSCPGPTTCLAVGRNWNGSNYQLFAERWNGTSWSIVPIPSPSAALYSGLNGVSCASTTNCVAVGFYSADDYIPRSLAVHWNGSTWSIVPSPTTPSSSDTELESVSCPSTTSCFAVGYVTVFSGDTLVEHWNGTTWSRVTSPDAPGDAILRGISCPSVTSCNAVGSYKPAEGGENTFVERWNGTSWSITPSPNPRGSALAVLAGVTCSSATRCDAVGSSTAGSTTSTLVERWTGTTWVILRTPNPTVDASLRAIACPAPGDCHAVGFSGDEESAWPPPIQPFAEHWNHTSWSITPAQNPSNSTSADLRGVACPTATTCFAVGENITPVGHYALIERHG